jgi:hypothetical protein
LRGGYKSESPGRQGRVMDHVETIFFKRVELFAAGWALVGPRSS